MRASVRDGGMPCVYDVGCLPRPIETYNTHPPEGVAGTLLRHDQPEGMEGQLLAPMYRCGALSNIRHPSPPAQATLRDISPGRRTSPDAAWRSRPPFWQGCPSAGVPFVHFHPFQRSRERSGVRSDAYLVWMTNLVLCHVPPRTPRRAITGLEDKARFWGP